MRIELPKGPSCPATRALRRAARFAGVLLLASVGCGSPSFDGNPDATVVNDAADPIVRTDAGFPAKPDAALEDGGFLIIRSSLVPAASAGSSAEHKLRGGMRNNYPGEATSAQHKLRGRFVPLSR